MREGLIKQIRERPYVRSTCRYSGRQEENISDRGSEGGTVKPTGNGLDGKVNTDGKLTKTKEIKRERTSSGGTGRPRGLFP